MDAWNANKLYVVDGRVMRLLIRLVEHTGNGELSHPLKLEIIDIVAQQPMIETEAYAAAGGLAAALSVIRKGLGDGRPYEGYFPMRQFLRDRKIYEGDLQEDAVIVAVIDAALAAYHEAVPKEYSICENHQSDCAQKSGGICTCISNNQQSKQD